MQAILSAIAGWSITTWLSTHLLVIFASGVMVLMVLAMYWGEKIQLGKYIIWQRRKAHGNPPAKPSPNLRAKT